MKSYAHFAILLLALFFFNFSIGANQLQSQDEVVAISVVNSYLDALMAGDVTQLQTYLNSVVINKRRALLNNPSYPQQLQNAYSNATYEVVGSRMVAPGKVEVDIKIFLNNSDTVHSRFSLSKSDDSFLIVSEK